jgi:hypothetical protein
VPHLQPVLAMAERLVRDDERAHGGDEPERRQRGNRERGRDEGEQRDAADRPAAEDSPGHSQEERDVPEQVESRTAA